MEVKGKKICSESQSNDTKQSSKAKYVQKDLLEYIKNYEIKAEDKTNEGQIRYGTTKGHYYMHT